MKKLIILCVTTFFLIPAKAQIPNPGFELRKTDGTAANWQPGGFVIIPADSTCITQGWDSIQTSTHDAHSGSYAYEVRVATTCTDAYSGKVQSNRIDSGGFIDQRIPISGQPSAFTFYYKLSSIQGDVGIAEASMQDQVGNSTGDGIIQLLPAAAWTLSTIPMQYAVSDTGGYLRLRFYLGNANGLHYGTRFVIDDIGQSAPTGISATSKTATRLDCFPSPAQNSISIRLNGAVAGANAMLTVTDIASRIAIQSTLPVPQDKTFVIDTRSLAPGLYYIRLLESNRIAVGRFSK